MKIIIAGGSVYLGELLTNAFKKEKENQVYILTRKQKLNYKNVHYIQWNGISKGYIQSSSATIYKHSENKRIVGKLLKLGFKYTTDSFSEFDVRN